MAKATLLVIQGVDQGARFEVGDEPVGVGRGVRNEVRILDTEVSRQHALFRREGSRYTVTDRNSSNGTFVNGAACRTRELHHGDQVQVGRTVMLFSLPDSGDSSRFLADRVNLVSRDHPDDRSHIVTSVDRESARALLDRRTETEPSQAAQSLANLQTLYRITEAAASPSASNEQLLKRILDLTIEAVGADRGCVLVTDPLTHEIAPQVFSVRGGAEAAGRMTVSRSIVDYVLQHGTGVRTSDARTDQRFEQKQSILQAGIREALCVPMHGRFELLGVFYLDTTTPAERVVLDAGSHGRFTDEQLRLLVAVGRQSALAIENNRYQQALVKAERLAAMGQTIAVLSHHIKNILQGIRGGSYLIDMGLKNHAEDLVRKGWGIVEKNQGKIYHMVMDMLTFSKERQPVMQPAALNETVEDVCELMQARAAECQVALHVELSPDIAATTFDAESIHRAVLNVVTNAIDAVEGTAHGEVRVETGLDPAADMLFVSVADNGPGISEEQLARIFNIFESTKGGRGTGLGLAVSQKILREHGGEIRIESAPGQGAKFVLAWPRLDDEHRHLDAPSNA